MTRFVVTVEQVEDCWKVHVTGPGNNPVNAMGSELEWPMTAMAAHMAAVAKRAESPAPCDQMRGWWDLPSAGR